MISYFNDNGKMNNSQLEETLKKEKPSHPCMPWKDVSPQQEVWCDSPAFITQVPCLQLWPCLRVSLK